MVIRIPIVVSETVYHPAILLDATEMKYPFILMDIAKISNIIIHSLLGPLHARLGGT